MSKVTDQIYFNVPQVGGYFYHTESKTVMSILACIKFVFDADCDQLPAFAVIPENQNIY